MAGDVSAPKGTSLSLSSDGRRSPPNVFDGISSHSTPPDENISNLPPSSERVPPPLSHDGTGVNSALWRNVLASPRYVVAPMVDQSETAWRMLSRKYGAQLCYTPMYHANVFVRDVKYRNECLNRCKEDSPLIIQFCCNSVETLVEAARYCVGKFDAVDLNLGCPQAIAKRGHYGAYLQDEWDLIYRMVNAVHTQLTIPITCKIRVFDCLEKTIRYARMLQSAGCQMLTVHGRTREMRGPLTGLADWDHIGAVTRSLDIPVLANGNIQYLDDVHRCMEHTGAVGVMSAEGNLHNPALFAGLSPTVWRMASEYLQLAVRYPCPLSYSRGHIFKLLHYCLQLPCNADTRQLVARAASLDQLQQAVDAIRNKYQVFVGGDGGLDGGSSPSECWSSWQPTEEEAVLVGHLRFPPFICQPHEREPIDKHLQKLQANVERQQVAARAADNADKSAQQLQRSAHQPHVLSKRQQKKMARGKKLGANRLLIPQCQSCPNPRGSRCEYVLCRLHCRLRCYQLELDCAGHRISCKTRRQRAREFHGTLRVDLPDSRNGTAEISDRIISDELTSSADSEFVNNNNKINNDSAAIT